MHTKRIILELIRGTKKVKGIGITYKNRIFHQPAGLVANLGLTIFSLGTFNAAS
jgi:hypothetical protein